MKENKYAKLSTDELKVKAKKLKSIISLYTGMLMVLMFVVVFFGIRQGFSVISAFPFILFPILYVILKNAKELQEEIKSRS
jgi:hypothetical protein